MTVRLPGLLLLRLSLLAAGLGACGAPSSAPGSTDGAVDPIDGGERPPGADEDIAAVRAACSTGDRAAFGLLEAWTASGPGTVRPVPLAHPRTPDIVYVLAGPTPSALHASVDGARSFCPLPAPALDWVVISPSNPRVLFGALGGELFTSQDAGRAWLRVGTVGTLPNTAPAPLAIHPARPGVLFTAPRWEVDLAGPARGIVRFERSNDGGRSWSTVKLAGLHPIIKGVRLSLGTGEPLAYYLTVYADYGAASGVHVSRDGGATWAAHAVPTTSSDLALLVGRDGRLVLTAEALWTSFDDGKSWQRSTLEPALQAPRAFAAPDARAGTFYVAGRAAERSVLLRTVTGGAEWTDVSPPEGTETIDAAPSAWGTTIYLASSIGVLGTNDEGRRWDLRWLDVRGSIAPSVGGDLLFATAPQALFVSSDAGRTWSGRPSPRAFLFGAVGAGLPPTHYLAEEDGSERRLRKSTDEGRSWGELPGFRGVSDLAVAGDGTLFVAEYQVDGAYNGVFRSEDRGGTFTRVHDESVSRLELAAGGERLYAFQGLPGLFARAAERGRQDGASLTTRSCRDVGSPIRCIEDVLFVSDDRGTSWRVTGIVDRTRLDSQSDPSVEIGPILALATHATDPATVAVLVHGQGLYLSHDAGASFERLALPLSGAAHLSEATLLATAGDLLFVAERRSPSALPAAVMAHPLTRPGDWIEIAPATLPAVQSMSRGPDDSLLLSTDGGLFRFRPGRR